MLSTSLKSEIEVFQMPPSWIPAAMNWNNYVDALTFNPFGTYFLNSLYFALMVVVAEVVSNSFIAFGFARLRAPRRNVIFIAVLATLMIPNEVTLIPQYVLFSKLEWLNSFKPLSVPAWFGSAYLIFLMRQFYMGLPKEYDEAAIIEGAGYLTIWSRIILPLSKPVLDVVAISLYLPLEHLSRPPDLSERQSTLYCLAWASYVPYPLWRDTLALKSPGWCAQAHLKIPGNNDVVIPAFEAEQDEIKVTS